MKSFSFFDFHRLVYIIEFITSLQKFSKNKNIMNLSSILFFFYLYFIYFIIFDYLVAISKLKILVFILLLICVFSDIGGLTGKIFKGPKLIKVSPNKTVSGSLGSFLIAVAMSINFSIFFNKYFTTFIPLFLV